jgi:hypothetical protein
MDDRLAAALYSLWDIVCDSGRIDGDEYDFVQYNPPHALGYWSLVVKARIDDEKEDYRPSYEMHQESTHILPFKEAWDLYHR